MSMEETAKTVVKDLSVVDLGIQDNGAQKMKSWFRKPTPNLSKPFGSFHWPLECIAIVVAIIAVLLFARVIDVGSADVSWLIKFNVNVAVALIIVVLGIATMLPRAIKNPREALNSNSIISVIILLLIALYFLSGDIPLGLVKGINLGTFIYTIAALNFGLLGGALLFIVLLWLAFRGSIISILATLGMFLWWGFSIDGLNLSIFSGDTHQPVWCRSLAYAGATRLELLWLRHSANAADGTNRCCGYRHRHCRGSPIECACGQKYNATSSYLQHRTFFCKHD